MIAPQPQNVEEGVQAALPEPETEDNTLKIRPLGRITRHPKVPVEPPIYGQRANYSRPWILQDGRAVPFKGSEMKEAFKVPRARRPDEGVRSRLLRDFFWEQMLDEMLEELSTQDTGTEYCTEYDANYQKENFQPRDLDQAHDKNMHLKYPLYGTGSSAITFYSQNARKTGEFEILEPFRRCQYFTRPMEERLDDGWVL